MLGQESVRSRSQQDLRYVGLWSTTKASRAGTHRRSSGAIGQDFANSSPSTDEHEKLIHGDVVLAK